jgi:hypothetical protein
MSPRGRLCRHNSRGHFEPRRRTRDPKKTRAGECPEKKPLDMTSGSNQQDSYAFFLALPLPRAARAFASFSPSPRSIAICRRVSE